MVGEEPEMLPDYFEAERVMMERVRDALREAEQARLIREVKGSRESQGRIRAYL